MLPVTAFFFYGFCEFGKKSVEIWCVTAMMMTVFTLHSCAPDGSGSEAILLFEDGSYCVDRIRQTRSPGAETIRGEREYTCFNREKKRQWVLTLTGCFLREKGGWVCRGSEIRAEIHAQNWSAESLSSAAGENTARGEASVKSAGDPLRRLRLSLTCDGEGFLR